MVEAKPCRVGTVAAHIPDKNECLPDLQRLRLRYSTSMGTLMLSQAESSSQNVDHRRSCVDNGWCSRNRCGDYQLSSHNQDIVTSRGESRWSRQRLAARL